MVMTRPLPTKKRGKIKPEPCAADFRKEMEESRLKQIEEAQAALKEFYASRRTKK
jgi:hypothetical protein